MTQDTRNTVVLVWILDQVVWAKGRFFLFFIIPTTCSYFSHLMGMFYRTIRMLEHGIKPVYVFDGKPPQLKSAEVSMGSDLLWCISPCGRGADQIFCHLCALWCCSRCKSWFVFTVVRLLSHVWTVVNCIIRRDFLFVLLCFLSLPRSWRREGRGGQKPRSCWLKPRKLVHLMLSTQCSNNHDLYQSEFTV